MGRTFFGRTAQVSGGVSALALLQHELPPGLSGLGDEQAGRTERREAAAARGAVRREFSLVGLELFFLARGRAFRAASRRGLLLGLDRIGWGVGHADNVTCRRELVKDF
jgi:hypothetical protein